MSKVVSYELIDNIGLITVRNPPVNALSHALRKALQDVVDAAQDDASEGLVLMCAGRTFIAGADISEFNQPPQSPSLSDLLERLENSNKLIVAAIHGTALGGGFETALSCHYRCALSSAKMGLPEVKLGLLPGAGGTQRVPRLAGVQAALDLLTSGNPIAAARACALHLIDEVLVGDELKSAALAYTKKLVAAGAALKRVRDITIDPASIAPEFFAVARKKLAARARGQIAAEHIVSCIEAAVNLPMNEGLALERRLFMECLQSPQSKALRHVFFAEREAAKIKGLPADTAVRDIERVAIVGGGTMGGGIAMCFANAGIPVTILEINEEALARGLNIVRKNYTATVSKGRMGEAQKAARLSLISGTSSYEDLAHADLVIEAVFENPDVKKEVFARLDTVCKPGAILATNTSYQDVDEIAGATRRPQDVVGMHFFSPAHIMRLLEIVRAQHSADEVLATVMKIGKRIGKVCVLSRVCYGFIGNRMLTGYLRQAHMLLLDGASPAQVDAAAEEFGMAMGPLAMSDLAGLDIGYRAREAREAAGEFIGPETHCVSSALVELGRLGQKSGAGYYTYDPLTRARQEDPEVAELILVHAQKLGVKRRALTNEEIVARLLYPLINEGARILEEGVAQRPGDIDVVYVYGYAFPAAKGGPMFYADQLGLVQVYDTIMRFQKELGPEYWQAAPLLASLAQENGSFAAWAKAQD